MRGSKRAGDTDARTTDYSHAITLVEEMYAGKAINETYQRAIKTIYETRKAHPNIDSGLLLSMEGGKVLRVVIDASAVLALLLPDEEKSPLDAVFETGVSGKTTLLVPSLIYFEVANGLLAATRQKRITRQEAQKLLTAFLELPLVEMNISYRSVLELASERDLSVYNASYVWLSKSENAELITLDTKLR